VLANTVYFNAAWAVPFDEEDTKDEPFHLLNGKDEIVAMMHQRDDFRYTEGRGYRAIQLPYMNREVGMVILLPGEGQLQEMEERLAGDWVQSVVASLSEQDVVLTMPKFGFETSVLNLVNTLSAMGMPDAFSLASADFSGITEPHSGSSLYISRVLHKAFINVDDQRTEAAAATIIAMPPGMVRGTPTEPPPITMRIDRPFIFLIRDIETDAILFIGRVMNPNE
jgi:serpin B